MTEQTVQKYVTDGTHVYHYNEYLAELIARGDLKYCDRPLLPAVSRKKAPVLEDDEVSVATQERLASGMKGDEDK